MTEIYAPYLIDPSPGRCVWCGLPVLSFGCPRCFPRSKPSREALLAQACLNAAAADLATMAGVLATPHVMTTPADRYLRARTLGGTYVSESFEELILAEWRKLVETYDAA